MKKNKENKNARPSYVVPLKNEFKTSHAHIIDLHRSADPGTSYTVVPRGIADLYPQ